MEFLQLFQIVSKELLFDMIKIFFLKFPLQMVNMSIQILFWVCRILSWIQQGKQVWENVSCNDANTVCEVLMAFRWNNFQNSTNKTSNRLKYFLLKMDLSKWFSYNLVDLSQIPRIFIYIDRYNLHKKYKSFLIRLKDIPLKHSIIIIATKEHT